jgi:hypothetical protein
VVPRYGADHGDGTFQTIGMQSRNASTDRLTGLKPRLRGDQDSTGHVTEMTGHVPEFGGHDAETVGYDGPKYANALDFTNEDTRKAGCEVDEVKKAKNRNKSKIRSRVEPVFAVVKRLWGFDKVRYRGLAKNATRAFVTLAMAHIYLEATPVGTSECIASQKRENGLQSRVQWTSLP